MICIIYHLYVLLALSLRSRQLLPTGSTLNLLRYEYPNKCINKLNGNGYLTVYRSEMRTHGEQCDGVDRNLQHTRTVDAIRIFVSCCEISSGRDSGGRVSAAAAAALWSRCR